MKFENTKLATLVLRLGLAFVFLFAAYTSLLHPENYHKFVPSFVAQLISIDQFLLIYGISEILLAIWLVIGKWAFLSGLISALLLLILTVLNLGEINTLFRNVAIITGALALVILSYKNQPKATLQPLPPNVPITTNTTTPTFPQV